MDLLGVGRLPFLSRRSYSSEFQHLLVWSVFAGVVEGQFASLVIARTFHGGDLLIALSTATPFAANLASLAWGLLCVGRPKIRLATRFAAGAVLCVGCVGAIANTPAGAVWFLLQIAAAQALLAGVVTVRSAIWRSNYPVELRGQIAARLQCVRAMIAVVTVQAASAVCDADGDAYRYVFPIAAAFGVVGIRLLARIHIRGERSELRRIFAGSGAAGTVRHLRLGAVLSPARAIGEMIRVLRADRRFARYQIAQLFHGVSNLLTLPIIVLVVTRELPGGDRWGFWMSGGLIVGLPALTLLGTLSRWGRLFDSLGVLRFRVVNVTCWVVGLLLGMFGTLMAVDEHRSHPTYFLAAVVLFMCRGLLYGLAQAGGKLAWNLGHLHFAQADQAEIYMGIHVFLTGVRGVTAPLAGMLLWRTIGWPVWLIAIGFALASLTLYAMLAREERSRLRS